MTERIAFGGVGRMGANLARRLKDCGYAIAAVFDAHPATARALAQELGCQAPDNLAQVTQLADVIFTVVTDDSAMKEIFRDGLLKTADGKLFINCATVSPAVHLWVEAQAEKAGAHSLEACMASSITQARQGSLYLMCGGKPEVFEGARPLLEKLSSSLRYIGPAGRAAQVKALVNMVMNSNTAALAEGLALGDALGLDLAMLREVFSQTGANSQVLKTDGEDMQKRDHACFFSAAHAAKDSGIALKLAKEQGLDLPLAAATRKQYARMKAAGLGELDKSGIAELTFKGRLAKHLTVLLLLCLLPLGALAGPRPNLLFVLIDDMGYADMSCYGEKRIQTIHLDTLAKEGIRFTQFYVASPICSPSRTGLITGQFPARWRMTSYLDNRQMNAARGMAQWLDPKAPVLARALQKAGYATGHFGKWHMGGQRDVGEAPLITEYGYDKTLTQFEGLGDRILPLLDAFDAEGLTRRAPEGRVLVKHAARPVGTPDQKGAAP